MTCTSYFNIRVNSDKVQPGATESPDFPDPWQAVVPVRTTRRRASKRAATGQFMCVHTVIHYLCNMHDVLVF